MPQSISNQVRTTPLFLGRCTLLHKFLSLTVLLSISPLVCNVGICCKMSPWSGVCHRVFHVQTILPLFQVDVHCYTSFLAFFLVLLSISLLVCGESLGTRTRLVCAQMQQVIFSFTRDVAIVIKFWHGFIDCISQA